MSNIGNIKFSYFDQAYNQVRENNIINVLGTWSTIIIYFDQTNIPIVTYPLVKPSPNTPSSPYDMEINVANNTKGITSLDFVGSNSNPLPLKIKPYKFILKNEPYICTYLNGYLTDFSCDKIFSPSYYDKNHNIITNSILKNITKIVILNPSNTNRNYPNKLASIFYHLSQKPSKTITCNNNRNVDDNDQGSDLINLKDPCYPPNTQLIWIGNPDASIVDYSKPYTIFKLYDANNNEIVNDPVNYSKVTQIAYFMSDTKGPYTPPDYTFIIIIISIFIPIMGLIYYYKFYNSKPTPENPIKSGLLEIGE
jgi:hypothetical protein